MKQLMATALIVCLVGASTLACAARKTAERHQVQFDNRMVDLQRSLDQIDRRMEGMQNDIMVLQDQMETTRIQVQKMELHGGKVKLAKNTPRPLIEIRSIDPATSNALSVYRQAYSLYEKGDLNSAQEKFNEFVKANPSHDYADNAVYWMGEAYYDQKEYLLAITEFQRVIQSYPTSNKLADAWLKIGLSYERLDDAGKAALAYQNVSEQYPYTSAAKHAALRLEKLKR